MATAFEIELTAQRGCAVWFAPLQRRLRAEIKVGECVEADRSLDRAFPAPIAGQVVGLTGDGMGFVRDRLAEPAQAAVRAKIEALGLTLGPARESCGPVDQATWVHWCKRLLAAGLGRLVSGELPEKVPGKPRLLFVSAEREDPRDGLLKTLVALLAAKLSPAERETFEATLDSLESN